MKIKRLLSLFMVICLALSVFSAGFTALAAEAEVTELSANSESAEVAADADVAEAGANLYGLADNVQDGQILQCWLWSYNNITKNLQKIAEQGFSAIQVSPIQPIKESTKESWNTIQNSSWVVYQPVAFNIEDNYRNAQGTKTEFKAMCEKAHKYGIKVIVDTVFNHMANDMSGNTIHPWVPSEIRENSDCWHDISKNISNYDDRYQTTHYCLTGLPDLNTANSTVQKHCINFMKEAIDAGADGFRFDAVKHIETPSDSSSIRSNFWPNVLNAATEYAQETRGFTPYYYGELLGSPGGSLSISAYTQYMSVTDAGSSDSIRNGVCNGNASQAASGNISNGAAKNKTVHWTESHDNHKDNGTNMISEHNINKTWAMIGSKDKVCGMYLARPEDMSETMMGDADMTSWSYPEVRAVNRFKNAFVGQSEYLSSYNKLACVERGTSGMIIVNTGGSYYANLKVPVHKMASGTYTDVITGNTFTVSGGYIKGDMGDTGIAVVYNPDSTGAFTKGQVTDFSIAGTMNDWDANAHKLVAKDANTATATMFLKAGTYKFKLTGNGLWYGNKGIIEDTTTEVGWTVRTSVDENCTLVASGGKYTFTFNITTGKLVIMNEAVSDKISEVFLMGTFNNWADTDPMIYVDDTNTVEATVKLSSGTYEFKIHNAFIDVWYGNTGTISNVTGETGWTMKPGEDKCTLTATGGTYTFKYDLSTNKLIVEVREGEVSTFTVTFLDWNGDLLYTSTAKYGAAANVPPIEPSREGYTFKGWSADISSVTEDMTVTAVYSEDVTYLKGTFNNWDTSNKMTSTSDPEVVTTTLDLEAGTYEFKVHSEDVWYGNNGTINDTTIDSPNGWSMATGKKNCTLVATGGTYTFNFNTTTHRIVVLYKPTDYKVTFKDWDGTVLSVQTVTKGGSAESPETPTREGNVQYSYTFKEWDKDFTNITADTVLTAVYIQTLNKYTVTFKDFDGTELSVQTVEYGMSATAPEAPAREGNAQYSYTFKEWDKDFSNITGDIVVTAVYDQTVNKYTVIFKDFDGTELSVQTIEYGVSATAPEDPAREGYKFTGWDKDFTNITEDIVVTAQYSKNTIAVTTGKLQVRIAGGIGFKISVNGGNLRPQGATYTNTKMPVGVEVTVVANNTNGATFLGWMDEYGAILSPTDTYTFVASGNDYLKACYQTEVEGVNSVIFKNAKASGGNGAILDMQYYAAGDEITFPSAPSQAGYTFSGWSMTTEDIQQKLTAGEDVTVLAKWEVAKVYIDVTVNGGEISTAAQPNGQYLAYNALTVVAGEASEGQKFAYWTDADGRIMSYDAEYKFYPSKDTELTAVYVASGETVVKKPLAFIAGDPSDMNTEAIMYTMSWDIDESIGTVTAAGLMWINEADYNEDTFKHGSGDGKLFDRTFAAQFIKQKNTYSINKTGSLYGNTYVACLFVIYTDATTGESVTIYSDSAIITKPAP